VWADPWLREDENSFISSEQIQGMESMKVADLMSGENWN